MTRARWTDDDYPQTRRCERCGGHLLVVSPAVVRRVCNACVEELRAALEAEGAPAR